MAMTDGKTTISIDANGEPTTSEPTLRQLRAEDLATDAVHEVTLVSEVLGQVSTDDLTLTPTAADGLDLILTRAAIRTQALLDLLSEERANASNGQAPEGAATPSTERADVPEQPSTAKTPDDVLGMRAIADAAHMDALTARAALERLTSLLVQGELDPHIEGDMDALACFAEGIIGQIGAVAEALDTLTHRIRRTE